MALNPSVEVDLDTVSPQSFPIKAVANKDPIELGQKDMPNADGITQHGTSHETSTNLVPPIPSEPSTLDNSHA